MQADQPQQHVEHSVVPVRGHATRIETHEPGQGPGLDAVHVHGEEPEHDLRREQA